MARRMLALLCALACMMGMTPAWAEGAAPVSPAGGSTAAPVETEEPERKDLSNGARGDEVLRLQQRLAELGFFFTAEDGIYGANTQNAIREFENYLRVLEQDEIERIIETNKTPEPTAKPAPSETPAPQATTGSPAEPEMDVSAAPSDEATDAPTLEPTPEPTPVPTPETPVDGVADEAIQEILFGDAGALYRRDAEKGDRGEDVLRIQRRLIYLNYLNDEPDGAFGVNTETAVKAFQREHDMNETGVADRAMQDILFSTEAVRAEKPVYNQLYLGVVGDDVKAVQKQLRLLGFMNAAASGTFDQKTQAAVMLLESYLYQLDMADQGIKVVTATSTPVPEEILEQQGEIEGDPESNPYEVMPGEENTEPDTETAAASGKPEGTIDPEAAQIAEAAASAAPTEEPIASAEPSGEPAAEAASAGVVPANPNGAKKNDEAFVPTGIVTAEMQYRLLEEGIPVYTQTVLKGSTGEQVKRVQRRLYALSYLTANGVDGILGKGSETAITQFQWRNKLPETGIADQATQAVLFSEDAIKAIKPYQIKISVDDQKVYVYTHNENDEYSVLVKEFICSTGLKSTPTPKGTFTNTGPGARWHYFKKFECWAQYAYYIDGDIMFHSVIYNEKDEDTLVKSSLRNLGSRASHGCVRLKVEDAKWIYENCKAGTTVIVY